MMATDVAYDEKMAEALRKSGWLVEPPKPKFLGKTLGALRGLFIGSCVGAVSGTVSGWVAESKIPDNFADLIYLARSTIRGLDPDTVRVVLDAIQENLASASAAKRAPGDARHFHGVGIPAGSGPLPPPKEYQTFCAMTTNAEFVPQVPFDGKQPKRAVSISVYPNEISSMVGHKRLLFLLSDEQAKTLIAQIQEELGKPFPASTKPPVKSKSEKSE
jgi:hypothetical protein